MTAVVLSISRTLLAAIAVLCVMMAPFGTAAMVACDAGLHSASEYDVDRGHVLVDDRHDHQVSVQLNVDIDGNAQPDHTDEHCTHHLCFLASTSDDAASAWIMQQALHKMDVASLVNAATDGPRRPPRA